MCHHSSSTIGNRRQFIGRCGGTALALLAGGRPDRASAAPAGGDFLFLEAEGFDSHGGWDLDQQSMDQMGSPYLLAHGLGVPVADAVTKATFPSAGNYRVWVRTRDWVAPIKDPTGPLTGRSTRAIFQTSSWQGVTSRLPRKASGRSAWRLSESSGGAARTHGTARRDSRGLKRGPDHSGNRACRIVAAPLDPYGMDHHVYFWLNEDRKNSADRAAFEQGLAGLLELPGTAGGRWSVPAKVELRPVVDQSWDYALSMTFGTLEDHDSYQCDPDHLRFVETFKPWWAKVRVMDLA